MGDILKELTSQVLRNDPSIVTLALQEQGLGDSDIELLIKALNKNSVVTEVDLRFNKLGPGAGLGLGKLLAQNHSILRLKLHGNALGDLGIDNLCQGLSYVQHLDIGGNKITSHGLLKLADALKHSTAIHFLDISENSLGEEGAEVVCGLISSGKSLATLDLGWNELGNKGIHRVADALAANTSLKHIVLRVNNIDDEGAGKLCDAFRKNKTLKSVDLEGNKFTTEGHELLESARDVQSSISVLKLGSPVESSRQESNHVDLTSAAIASSSSTTATESSAMPASVFGQELECSNCKVVTMHLPLDPSGTVACKKNVQICSRCFTWYGDAEAAKENGDAESVSGVDQVVGLDDDESVSSGEFHDPLAEENQVKKKDSDSSEDEADNKKDKGILDEIFDSSSSEDEDESVVHELPRRDNELEYKTAKVEVLDAEEMAMIQNARKFRELRESQKLHKRKQGTCSWCYNKCDQMRVQRGGIFKRDVYECQSCRQRTLPCRFCDEGFSRASTGLLPNDQLCSRCTEFRAPQQ